MRTTRSIRQNTLAERRRKPEVPRKSGEPRGANAARDTVRERIRVLENLIEHMDQGVSVMDADLRVVGTNRRFRELLAFPESLCRPGTPLETFFRYNAARGDYGPGDVEEQVRTRMELARKFEAHRFERERPDGTVLEIRGLPIPGGGFVTLYTDVTQRMRSERALKASEERYDVAMRAINEGVYDYDIANDTIYYSDRVYEVLDTTRDLLRTTSDWRRLIHPGDLAGYIAAYVAHMKGESARFALDYRYRGRGGALRWARQRGLALRDGEGRAVRVVGSVGDITEIKQTEEALRESEARKSAILEASLDAVLTIDREGRITDFNPAAERCFGYTRDRVIGREMAELIVPPELRERHREGLRRYLATGEARILGRRLELPALRAHGSRFDAELTVSLIPGSDPPAFTGTVRDITERAAAAKALRESEERFRSLTQLSADWYWEQDDQFRFTMISGAGAAAMSRGGEPSAYLGKARWETPDLSPMAGDWSQHRAQLERHEPFRDLLMQRRMEDGSLRYMSVSGEPVLDQAGRFKGYRGVASNVTARVEAEQALRASEARLEQLAHYDALTGLPNRALLRDRMLGAMARAERSRTLLAVMFLDLDRFKEINDSLGHAIGDEVLKETARRLLSCLRSTDTVGRLGGDEFTVLLEDLHHVDEISIVARKIIEAFGEPAEVAGHELHLSASVGISVFPLDDQDADTLLKNSDIAMYQAKQEGRNNFQFFKAEMAVQTRRRADLRLWLHRALERGEFALHYQPQVGLAGGCILGVEALLRWNSAELGPVSPAQFIPVAEETGLIVPLGDWVLREACRQCKSWLDAGLGPLRVAVNLSPRQFRQKKLARRIGEILDETGLPAACLEIEITEGIVMQHAGRAIATLTELNRLGVQIAIDDFGTGYSSLAYLQRFPIQVLKIDQSFVQAIRGGTDEAAIVNTVIQLAKLLGLKTLAEGVETDEQLEYLRSHGCDAFQGYLYCKPQPAESIGGLLAANRRAQRARAPQA